MIKVENSTLDRLDTITIVKCEPFDQDMGDTTESIFYCGTESSDCSSSQPFHVKQEPNCSMDNAFATRRMYNCEQCGHMNTITTSLADDFSDSSQSIENSQARAQVFQVSIDPDSLELKSNPFSPQLNEISNDDQERNGDNQNAKKKKRLIYPGDVGDDEELGEQSAQKYISVLRKTVMDQRKQTKTLMQQNRRQQQRINKLKSMLKELVEKTKNGNYVIEA